MMKRKKSLKDLKFNSNKSFDRDLGNFRREDGDVRVVFSPLVK